jgi:hypothetical protein
MAMPLRKSQLQASPDLLAEIPPTVELTEEARILLAIIRSRQGFDTFTPAQLVMAALNVYELHTRLPTDPEWIDGMRPRTTVNASTGHRQPLPLSPSFVIFPDYLGNDLPDVDLDLSDCL